MDQVGFPCHCWGLPYGLGGSEGVESMKVLVREEKRVGESKEVSLGLGEYGCTMSFVDDSHDSYYFLLCIHHLQHHHIHCCHCRRC